MSESKDATIALNVRLKPSDSSAHPRAANYTNVGIAQGIAYAISGSSSQRCWLRSQKRRRTAKRPRKVWTATSSLAWRWMSVHLRGCSSNFSKCWWGCKLESR